MIVTEWKCDFPGCGKRAENHEGWKEVEEVWPRPVLFFLTIPFIGNVIAMLVLIDRLSTAGGIHHLCPEHSRWLL